MWTPQEGTNIGRGGRAPRVGPTVPDRDGRCDCIGHYGTILGGVIAIGCAVLYPVFCVRRVRYHWRAMILLWCRVRRSVGRLVCGGGLCVYVFVRRYLGRRGPPLRGVRHRASPPEFPALNMCLAYAPAGGPGQGPLSGVVFARSAAFGGRLRVTLVLGFFARLLCERGLLPRCLWGLAAAFVALGLS